MNRITWSLSLLFVIHGVFAAEPAAIDLRDQDYLTQARLRTGRHVQDTRKGGNVTTKDDAAGAVDGIKNGQWGFHTSPLDQPAWWQVDLGSSEPLVKALLFNRCDFPTRTAKLELVVSDDAKTWTKVYAHDGKPFAGFTDGKPLVIDLKNVAARFVRLQIPPKIYFHLDEVEIYAAKDPKRNVARGKPADQSSVSQWSVAKTSVNRAEATATAKADETYPLEETLERAQKLAAVLGEQGVDVGDAVKKLEAIKAAAKSKDADLKALYLDARRTTRSLVFANPQLKSFEKILFLKRAPASFSHMSDQYYSWWTRPGGGVYVLENIAADNPTLRCLTGSFELGSFLAPDLSYDAKKVLFSYCKHIPGRDGIKNKVDKSAQPEEAFYHVFEMNVDGTGLRQVTRGRYDDLFPRYLPDGRIVFLSTRRGTFIQCGQASAESTRQETLADSFVRCGGDNHRPVSIYTLHTMAADGTSMRAISAFESFEWDPAVASDGRIFYARWDYVDRTNGPFMKLWATNPDGGNASIVFGNYTRNPQCIFEARSIPGSNKILATASAHHSITAGSLVLIDPSNGLQDGDSLLKRLTPEVCFPETEGWPTSYYTNPWPLSEQFYLCAWSNLPLSSQGRINPTNALGLYVYDCLGNLEPLYRDPDISSMYPIPVKPRYVPPVRPDTVDWTGPQVGTMVVQDVYRGLTGVERGAVKSLRLVAMPVKVQPHINVPKIGVTGEDPGKAVLGTVPVEADGSAHFVVPSGVSIFFQALDARHRAVQTMRSLTYVQAGQTLSCIGCHEKRAETPRPSDRPLAMQRPPSRIKPDPDGSYVLRFDKLVQPILDAKCVSCHQSGYQDANAARFVLTNVKAYDTLVAYGKPSLTELVKHAHGTGASEVGRGPSIVNPLLALFEKRVAPNQEPGHYGVTLTASERHRLIVWMDTYAQKQGAFSDDQEADLLEFRNKSLRPLLEESAVPTVLNHR